MGLLPGVAPLHPPHGGQAPKGGPPRSVGVPSKKGAEGTNSVESGGGCGGELLSA